MAVDPVYEAFLKSVAREVQEIGEASECLTLSPASSSVPPDTYRGTFRGIEHLARASGGAVVVSRDPIEFTVNFPADYCRSTDWRLPLRVVTLLTPLFHPNVWGGTVCLGVRFNPGTPLQPLIRQLYAILTGRLFAAKDGLDREASLYYLRNLDRIAGLRARPLWREGSHASAGAIAAADPPRRDAP